MAVTSVYNKQNQKYAIKKNGETQEYYPYYQAQKKTQAQQNTAQTQQNTQQAQQRNLMDTDYMKYYTQAAEQQKTAKDGLTLQERVKKLQQETMYSNKIEQIKNKPESERSNQEKSLIQEYESRQAQQAKASGQDTAAAQAYQQQINDLQAQIAEMQNQQAQQQQAQANTNGASNAIAGISAATQAGLDKYQQGYKQSDAVTQAMQNYQNMQSSKPQAYQQSDAVTQAMQTLQNLQASKPQGYNSRYAAQLESILGQIQGNTQAPKYEFNGDSLFKAYADQYTQMGKQASLDAMGQAAGLTGGYGNSYAQAVGNQAYQQQLLGLYDKGLELSDRQYQKWLQGLNNQKDIYNMMAAQEAQDYNRYRDTVGDWQTEETNAYNRMMNERQLDYNRYRDTVGDWQTEEANAYNRMMNERQLDYNRYRDTVGDWQTEEANAYNRMMAAQEQDYNRYRDAMDDWQTEEANAYNRMANERNFDYSQYMDMLNYYTGLAQVENASYNSEAERQEAIRQYEQNFAENQRQYDTSMEEKIREFNATNALNQQSLAQSASASAASASNNAAKIAEDARQADLNYQLALLKQQAANEQADRDYQLAVWKAENGLQYDYDKLNAQTQYDYDKLQYDADKANAQLQYDYDKLNWQIGTDDRDYQTQVLQNQQNYASKYALAALENGQMPSADLLAAAGLDEENAAKLMTKAQTVVYAPQQHESKTTLKDVVSGLLNDVKGKTGLFS